jgi:hypothetical protein
MDLNWYKNLTAEKRKPQKLLARLAVPKIEALNP